jgi:hypothetical protein
MGVRRWRRDRGKERTWRRRLREWRHSGLSVREFCDGRGLSEPSFYAWRRELAKRDGESTCRGAGAVKGRARAPRVAGRFLRVQVVADAALESGADRCLEVDLPTGVRLRIPPGFDPRTLADVLAALEARAC